MHTLRAILSKAASSPDDVLENFVFGFPRCLFEDELIFNDAPSTTKYIEC